MMKISTIFLTDRQPFSKSCSGFPKICSHDKNLSKKGDFDVWSSFFYIE